MTLKVYQVALAPAGTAAWIQRLLAPVIEAARLDLAPAGRKYAREALQEPKFLRAHWKALLAACRSQLARGR